MTEDRMALIEAIQKADDGNFLRALAETVLQIIMDADVEALVGTSDQTGGSPNAMGTVTGRWRRGSVRSACASRNCARDRTSPAFWSRGGRWKRRWYRSSRKPSIGGVSTAGAMGMTGISKSSVSKLCKDIDERVNGFLTRPLAGEWPYLWLNATYLKVRATGRIVSVAAIIAVAVNTDGRREIVGLHIGPSEAEVFWSDFLKSLKARGLAGIKLVISDAGEGLKAAITRVLGATWQRCRVHWTRNALAYVPKGQHTMVAVALRQAFQPPDHAAARTVLVHVAEMMRPRWPKLADFIIDSEADVLAYMTFPGQHRTKLHSTNPLLERLNKEVKRRADVVGIFPNEEAIIRLIGAVLLEANDDWQLQHRYMQIDGMAELTVPLPDSPLMQIPPQAACLMTISDRPQFPPS